MSTDEGGGTDGLPDRVSWDDEVAVRAWAERLGVSPEVLRSALVAVGPSIARAKKLLGKE